MGLKDKFINFIAPPVEGDESEFDGADIELTREEARAIGGNYEKPKAKITKPSTNTKMVLFEPRSFDEAEEIARHLKERRACVVNLHRLQRDYAQRTIDFLTGVVFALDGTIQKIAHNAILCTPSSIEVGGLISLDHENE